MNIVVVLAEDILERKNHTVAVIDDEVTSKVSKKILTSIKIASPSFQDSFYCGVRLDTEIDSFILWSIATKIISDTDDISSLSHQVKIGIDLVG